MTAYNVVRFRVKPGMEDAFVKSQRESLGGDMPGALDGLGLAQICRERFPNIPVLLASGFSDAAQAADGRFDILRKPFELSALERAIETVRSAQAAAK